MRLAKGDASVRGGRNPGLLVSHLRHMCLIANDFEVLSLPLYQIVLGCQEWLCLAIVYVSSWTSVLVSLRGPQRATQMSECGQRNAVRFPSS